MVSRGGFGDCNLRHRFWQHLSFWAKPLSIAHEISLQNESQFLRSSYSWSPNGEWLLIFWGSSNWAGFRIAATTSGSVENQSLSPSYEISDECDYIRSYAISPDGARLSCLLLGSYDSYSARPSNARPSPATLQIFEDEDHYPRILIFSHDGTTLIGSSKQRNIAMGCQ